MKLFLCENSYKLILLIYKEKIEQIFIRLFKSQKSFKMYVFSKSLIPLTSKAVAREMELFD